MFAPIKLTVRITEDGQGAGFRLLHRRLTGFGKRRMLQAMGLRFREITRQNFGMAGIDRPTPWAPYARNYPKWGKRKGGPATLIRTGRLMQEIYINSNSSEYVEVGSDKVYAAAQQFGRAAARLPARPYFPIVGTGTSYRLTPYSERELGRVAVREVQRIGMGA
jgi:phage gpG-like protein